MKNMMIAASLALVLGSAAAFAENVPAGGSAEAPARKVALVGDKPDGKSAEERERRREEIEKRRAEREQHRKEMREKFERRHNQERNPGERPAVGDPGQERPYRGRPPRGDNGNADISALKEELRLLREEISALRIVIERSSKK